MASIYVKSFLVALPFYFGTGALIALLPNARGLYLLPSTLPYIVFFSFFHLTLLHARKGKERFESLPADTSRLSQFRQLQAWLLEMRQYALILAVIAGLTASVGGLSLELVVLTGAALFSLLWLLSMCCQRHHKIHVS